VQGKLNNKKNY